MHSYSLKFSIRTDKKKNGLSSMFVNGSIDGVPYKVPIGIEIPKESFLKEHEIIIPKGGIKKEEAQNLTLLLEGIRSKAQKIFDQARINMVPLTVNDFKIKLKSGYKSGVVGLWENYLETQPLKKSTLITYKNAIKIATQSLGNDFTTRDLISITHRADEFMRKKRLSFNTRQKYHARLKTLTKIASQEYNIPNPYDNWKVHRIEGSRSYLTDDEITKLIKLFREKSFKYHYRVGRQHNSDTT